MAVEGVSVRVGRLEVRRWGRQGEGGRGGGGGARPVEAQVGEEGELGGDHLGAAVHTT